MRLGVVKHEGRSRIAANTDGTWQLIADGPGDFGNLCAAAAATGPGQTAKEHVLGHVEFEAPLTPRSIIAVGLNYFDHIVETGMEAPTVPLLFGKLLSSVTGHESDIVVDPSITRRVDWEGEIAVVIGQRMRGVDAREAMAGVFGYTIANDVSARDLQAVDGQWLRAKSLDTFCPLGPYIVTADELPDPQDLAITTTVNGRTVQDSSTSRMLFSVAEIIEFCARHFTLHPGDLILTGTPWGCGEFADPRVSLADGDRVEVSIEGIDTLSNTVRFVRVPTPGRIEAR